MGNILSYKHGESSVEGVDDKLWDIVQHAIAVIPYNAEIRSGAERGKGDAGNHSGGYAIDVTLIDPATGKKLPDYQNGSTFAVYETYAQAARVYQQQAYPELNNTFRWGGYFSKGGSPFGYGAADLMHLDITPRAKGAMGLGSWDRGASKKLLDAYPGAVSNGGLRGPNGSRLVAQYQQSLKGSGGLVPPGNIGAPQPALMTAGLRLASRPADALAYAGQTDLVDMLMERSAPPSTETPKSRIAAAREEMRIQRNQAATRGRVARNNQAFGITDGEVTARVAPGLVDDQVFLSTGVPDPGSDFIQFDEANRMSVGGLGALLGKSFPMTVANPALPAPQGPVPATQSAALAAARTTQPDAPVPPPRRDPRPPTQSAEPEQPAPKKPAATAVLPSGKTVEIGRTYSFGGQTYVGGVDEKGVGTLNKVNIGVLSEAGKPTMVGKAVDAEIKKEVASGIENIGPAAQAAAASVGAVASDVAGRVGNLFGGLFGGQAAPASTRKLLTTDRNGYRVLIDAPNTRTGKLSDEYTKPSARARVATAKATATRSAASLPKLSEPGSERTGMLSAESARKVQPASAPLSFAKPIPPAIPTAQVVQQRVTIAPRAKPVLSAPGAGLTAAQKAAFGGYDAPNVVKEMAPLSAPGAGLTAAQKAAFGGYTTPSKPIKPAKVTTQTVAPQPVPSMPGANQTPKLAVTKQGQPVSMVPKTGYEKPQARVATPRTILPAKPPTPTFVSAAGQSLTPQQVRSYNPDTGTFETKTVYRAPSTAGAKLDEPRTTGTDIFGRDNANLPRSVQQSVRWQVGY